MKVFSLTVRDADGSVRNARSASARHGYGIGDIPRDDPGREIALTGEEILRKTEGLDGFCVKKFTADIVTEGLDYGKLSPGMLLSAGEAVLEIVSVGKKCFSDCPVEDKPCALNRGCAFAKVVREGSLETGDDVILSGNGG